jgi:non-canonical (house-cleaning) NTP pyrophosphatase
MIMTTDLKSFWQRLQTGVEVAVAGTASENLLGVRDAILRYFHDGLDRTVSVAVVPQTVADAPIGLPFTDEDTLRLARQRVEELESKLGGAYHFYIASESGIHAIDVDGGPRYFIRYWTVIRGTLGEAWGSSGSVQIPERIVAGLDQAQIPFAVPGTRRSGGIIRSLTGGLESRRKAISTATLHALSSLFYGILESRPIR